MRLKYVLARRLRERLGELRAAERSQAAQHFLFDMDAPVEATGAHAFRFPAGIFDGERLYRGGGWRFTKHFLGPDRVSAFNGKPGGEEEQCARVLDSPADLKWWARNVAKHRAAFWLSTAAARFYPDLVAQLEDGSLSVVEYKGEQGWADAELSRIAAAVWDRAGGGLFLMVRERADGLDMLGQWRAKLNQMHRR